MNANAALTITAYHDAFRAGESFSLWATESFSPFFSGTLAVKIWLSEQLSGYSATEPGRDKRTVLTDDDEDDRAGWDN